MSESRRFNLHARLRPLLVGLGIASWSGEPRAAAPDGGRWPPQPERDGVYGRFDGELDLSLKLGGLLGQGRAAGSVGISAHYYSSIGVVADYSESLRGGAGHTRSYSMGTELRPLFLPRWALDWQRGPAWLDLTLDSAALGFGAFFMDDAASTDTIRGIWLSAGLGLPVLGHATGPWLELRYVRRIPDHDAPGVASHDAWMLYVSWHQVVAVMSRQ